MSKICIFLYKAEIGLYMAELVYTCGMYCIVYG
jgi:hypothetical protein